MAGADLPQDRSIDGRDIRPYLVPTGGKETVSAFEFYYSDPKNRPGAIRKGPWKLHIRTISQTGNKHGFSVSRKTPVLFQVEQDLGQRINRANEQKGLVVEMMKKLDAFEDQMMKEGTFWDAP